MTINQFLKDFSIDLAPVQRLVLENMVFNDNSMTMLPRGGGKTLLLGLAALYIAINNKNQRVCMTATHFRQVKWPFTEIAQKTNLDAVFKKDFCSISLDNGSTIIGLAVADITERVFDYILVDEYQYIRSDLRDYIDSCEVEKISIMISDDIGNDGFVYLIANRKRCYKISKYLTPDYPNVYYDEEILRELEKYPKDGFVEK